MNCSLFGSDIYTVTLFAFSPLLCVECVCARMHTCVNSVLISCGTGSQLLKYIPFHAINNYRL